ncbi:CoA transferase [Sphingobium jiangsuense]|uniref:Crotonobetainyl-CoA:carnitine CoA-transferase CaiB-like acyl-CoA transferase n=1 Tax=Sphingobium jiangsuense TaxID=870476 RepID=A0A7W6BNQ5_9SPHN|nr:CoA transferase [Sphingobium jiangsuense]MBB3925958.1 crotonobetainyl-CoA:carnitine CoA-transferase CaiB-like acyl-CoA transferase [Sphingobium jiangsuense]GLS98892.1 CoA transferase [Sphingobium jiangsuense]
MAAALEGICVFDASAGVAGPYAAHLLSLAGADVIKVEPPQGEWGRIIGRKAGTLGLPFLTFNRGKRSLAIDLKHPEGRELARHVAGRCDVVVESFRPGVMDRLGLGYEALGAGRPDLVYLSISGFGTRGPHADRPALDTVIQAQSGWLDLLRDVGGAPVLMEYVPIDVLTGLYAAQAAMTALISRFRFGEGRRIDISLLEAAAAFLAPKLTEAALLPPATSLQVGVPTGIFPAADGLIALAIKDDREFGQLAQALGHPEWPADARFATRAARGEHRTECERAVVAALKRRTAAQWDADLARAGIVAAKVNTVRELLDDPHFKALDRIGWNAQPGLGDTPCVRVPGQEDAAAPLHAPAAGEHSREILADMGIDADRIASAVAGGIVRIAEQAA